MKKKNFIDIYVRNVKGVFLGFPSPKDFKHLWVLAVAIYIGLLPLTLTFGAGIKSLIDFFSRKNISGETLSSVGQQIDELDVESITPLIDTISQYEGAQSISSRKLIQMLQDISIETSRAERTGISTEKRTLQEDQLGIDKNPELLKRYQDDYISGLKLDKDHQQRLDDYTKQNTEHCRDQKFSNQKRVIKGYFEADHNYGKKMQQIICDHFLFPTKRVAPPAEVKSPITALPTF